MPINTTPEFVRQLLDQIAQLVKKYVKFVPVSILHEAPKEVPIRFDESGFRNSLPENIMDFLRKKIDVRNISPEDGILRVETDSHLRRGTRLYISFPECDDRHGEVVCYQKMERAPGWAAFNINSNDIPVRIYIPDDITDIEFNAWLEQSKNSASLQFFKETVKEYAFADSLKSMYLTRSNLRSELLSMSYDEEGNHRGHSLNADIVNLSIKLALPVFQDATLERIIDIRTQYGKSFKNFRVELGDRLKDIRKIEDETKLSASLEEMAYSIREVQVNDIDNEIRKLKKSLGIDTAVVTGSLLTGLIFGDAFSVASFATGLVVIAKDTKGAIKDILNVKNKPGYFLWKIQNKPWYLN